MEIMQGAKDDGEKKDNPRVAGPELRWSRVGQSTPPKERTLSDEIDKYLLS